MIAMVILTAESMIMMREPEIKNYIQPFTKQQKKELGPVNFAEKGFALGMTTFLNHVPSHIPPEVGYMYAIMRSSKPRGDGTWENVEENIELMSCKEFITSE